MLKQVIATLLLVVISSSQCISADNGYRREGWKINKKVDDLTDETKSITARLSYYRYDNVIAKSHELSITCYTEDKELQVMIGGGMKISDGNGIRTWFSLGTDLRILSEMARHKQFRKDITAEYRFNQEPALKDVWRKIQDLDFLPDVFIFSSLHPVGFAHELLRVIVGGKAQFRFREIEQQTLHFDLHGGAPFVRDVLGKCDALPNKGEE